MTAPFGARLAAAMDAHGPLCVGIDPHTSLLEAWGLPDDAAGLRSFALTVVDARRRAGRGGQAAGRVLRAARLRGVAVLEEVIAAGRDTGTLVIVDAKRGDIGSTMGAYADAFLRDGSPLAGDALTVSPYLGFGSLDPAVDLALSSGRGLFVLCLTSNKEGHEVQHARTDDGVTVGRAHGRARRGAERRRRPARLDRARRGRHDRRRGRAHGRRTWRPSTARCSRPGWVPRARARASWRRCSARHAGRCWPPRRAACWPPDPTSRRCAAAARRASDEAAPRGALLSSRRGCRRRSGRTGRASALPIRVVLASFVLTIPRTSTWVAGPLTRR